jgi:hypothetical protein
LFISITGGEVTQYLHLQEMLEHAKSIESNIAIRTNASQGIKDFCTMLSTVDLIDLEFHPEYTQTSHFLLCLHHAGMNPNLKVSVHLNAMLERWTETENLKNKISEKWPQFAVHLKMLFNDPVKNTMPLLYQPVQEEVLKNQSGDLIISSDLGEIEHSDYQSMIFENRNNFQDWSCSIGLEQIIVDAWGVVRRGHCRQGGSIGQIGSKIRFDDFTVTCKKPKCVNAFDIQATKIKLS